MRVRFIATAIILLTAMGVGALLVEAYSVDSTVVVIGAWLVSIMFASWASLLLYETVNIETVDTSNNEDGLE